MVDFKDIFSKIKPIFCAITQKKDFMLDPKLYIFIIYKFDYDSLL